MATSGTITIATPPVLVWSWDTSKVDPSGYRHIDSGVYKPGAKSDLIGGFDSNQSSGVALNVLTQTDLTPSATVVGGTKALTVSLGLPADSHFSSANAGAVGSSLRIYNIKMWLNDKSDLTASGVTPTLYYRSDSSWTKGIALTSASSGVAAFPETEGSGISLGVVNSGNADLEITNYVYTFLELPSGTYEQGVLGGLGGGYEIRVSYDFTAEGELL